MRTNYIIATAGHVDHGKTSLIKALTGKDCDTHPEEKKRGITIHLGFSHITLADDVHIGIVDVPGHKDFIDTMISGINGIDLVLFIVAADEGFMPQTSEHLQILNMLGVKRGIIVLTKVDTVDEETLYFATEEIKEKTQNTFLADAQIVQTSVITGENIDKIKPLLHEYLMQTTDTEPAQSIEQPFRLYPDRFFSLKGFGSVVTGTVISGEIHKNSTLLTIPAEKEVKIRRLEAYSQETDRLYAGQRASLNLTNFDKADFEKRVMLTDKSFPTTQMIDVQLSLFDSVPHLNIWSTCQFYTATIQTQAKIHLMDVDHLYPANKCFAQIHLDRPIPVAYNDKFIVRNSSGEKTLGGGNIIDTTPLHHRRRTQKAKQLLQMRVSGSEVDFVCTEIEKTTKPISIAQIKRILQIPTSKDTQWELPEKYINFENWLWIKHEQDKFENRIQRYLQIAHKNNPLDPHGRPIEEFISLLADYPDGSRSPFVRKSLQNLIERKVVDRRENTYALATHKMTLEHKDYVQINFVDQFILAQKMKTPLWSELTERGALRGIDDKRMKQILFYLIGRGRIVHYDGEYLHSFTVNPAREKLLRYLINHPEGCTVAQYRDIINGNRKICLILLNIFDREGITTRVEDNRFITEKGKKIVYQINDTDVS